MAKQGTKISLKKIMISIFSLLGIGTNCYLVYTIYLLNGIEDKGRFLVIGLLIAFDLLIMTEWFNMIRKKIKNKSYSIFMVLLTIYLMINMACGMLINTVYNKIDGVSKSYVNYSTSLVVLNSSNISLDNISGKNVGIVNDTASIDGYIISKEMIEKNNLKINLKEYNSFSALITALYDKEVDAIFITSGYTSMFNSIERFTNIATETKAILTQDKKVKKDNATSTKKLTDPFSILLMGVDSELDGLDATASSNGDSLIVVTFNPNTSNITMLSIPRDSYVPIMCFKDQIENKITHAAWYGTDCMKETVANFLDIPIDYYVKINFKGVVGLVDALGGISVDVPQEVCTNNSSRNSFICVKAGLQTLNGEQALVLARDRHSLVDGDLGREQNQQLVIMSIINKLKSMNSVDKIMNVLNTIAKNLDTNFSTNQILSFYNIGKEVLITNNNEINIDSLLLQGSGQIIYDENMGLPLWDYILNDNSVEAVSSAMKNNLNITNDYIKTFSYSVDTPYVQVKTGSEFTEASGYALLPDFTAYSKTGAYNWLEANGFNVSYVNKDSELKSGTIIDQSIPALKRLDKISSKSITLYVSNGSLYKEEVKEDKTTDSSTNDDSKTDNTTSTDNTTITP